MKRLGRKRFHSSKIMNYPEHLYEPIREEVAVSYIQHEFRKLLLNLPEKYFDGIDRDISGWMTSPEFASPRDFWNLFHGIAMGFKLKIGLIYLATAENIKWSKKESPVLDLWFGVEQRETKKVREGRLSAKEVAQFYSRKENEVLKKKFQKLNQKLSNETPPRDQHPIIAIQKEEEGKLVFSVHDGNRRLAKAVLEGKEKILAYLGEYTTKEKFPKNYWIPTSILMDNLFFAKRAYDQKDKKLFNHYMKVLKDMLSKSESAVYEMKERALTSQQPFRNDVLKTLKLI